MANKKISNPATRAVMKVVGEFEAMLREKPATARPFMEEVDPVGGDPVKQWYKDNGYQMGDLKG
jgi:hypothetical protein